MAISRRWFLVAQTGLGTSLMARGMKNRETVYRFAVGEYDIRMNVEYFDAYSTEGFRFADNTAGHHFCLSGSGLENRNCLPNFFGSVAIARYHVRPFSNRPRSMALREHVRTIDQDRRLRPRPPFDCAIRIERGVASDIQAFGYHVDGPFAPQKSIPGANGPWCLLRQDLYLDREESAFLIVHWKHTLSAIRLLDAIPAGATRLLSKPEAYNRR